MSKKETELVGAGGGKSTLKRNMESLNEQIAKVQATLDKVYTLVKQIRKDQ